MSSLIQINRYFAGIRNCTWQAVAGTLLLLVTSSPALAQVIDRIDVQRSGQEAEIVIRFVSQVQYLRHTPEANADTVYISFQLTGTDTAGQVTQEKIQVPPNHLIDGFSVIYPEGNAALALHFKSAANFRIQPGNDGRSISVFTPITVIDVEAQALQFITNAKEALNSKDISGALNALNQLLNLPPNKASIEGQELIGVAREMNGEPAKARAEYELYLKLYPDDTGAPRVRERLSKLGDVAAAPVARAAKPIAAPQWNVFGSVSQHYYAGNSQIETTTLATLVNPADTQKLSAADQSTLVSRIDINARYRTQNTDNRIVFSGTNNARFIANQKDSNRFSAAYYEFTDNELGYMQRIGRQPGNSGGVLGRFDGIWAGIKMNPDWRVNGVIGTPVDYNGSQTERKLVGMSIDLLPQPGKWTGSGYYIGQRISGIVDRRALGMEARYFDEKKNVFGLLDYDIIYKDLNIAMAQGSVQDVMGSNFVAFYDHRKAPTLLLTNALPGETLQSVPALLAAGISLSELRRRAALLTATSDLSMVGVTHRLTPSWQIGGDLRVMSISGTQASGLMPATQGTGRITAYTGQIIGNSIFETGDLAVASASKTSGASSNGFSMSLNHVTTVKQKWHLDSNLRYYSQKSVAGTDTKLTSPSIRISYAWKENINIESEAGLEQSVSKSAYQTEKTLRSFIYVGYRWDWI